MNLSVCMATYNGEQFIRQELKSILSQLDPADEVIVSDDSSTDATLAIVRTFNDKRIRIFPGNTFYSPIFNFEHALKQATGDIIVLSDQDDIWLPNKIAVIRERFAKRTTDPYLMVSDAEVIDAGGNPLHDSVFKRMRRVGPGLLGNIYDNSYMGCCMAFSRDLLAFALPFPRNIPMHDVWLGLIAEIYGKTEFVPVKTMLYRKHSTSATDFPLRFMPWTQLKRRFFLVCNLIRRYVARILSPPHRRFL